MSLPAPLEPWTSTVDSVHTHLAPTLQQTQREGERDIISNDWSSKESWQGLRPPPLREATLPAEFTPTSQQQKAENSQIKQKSTWPSCYPAKALEERRNHHSGGYPAFFSGLQKCVPWDNFLLASTISPKTPGHEILNEEKTWVCVLTHLMHIHILYTQVQKYRRVGVVVEMHTCVNVPQPHLQENKLSAARKTKQSVLLCSFSLLTHEN